ncbi:MAG TPA: DUF1329 domain-containing protein, partial [Candidatus Binataceae bacterium]|nr:DUF1329 domain-containing protein [Candidatus Binataceae bacterium]
MLKRNWGQTLCTIASCLASLMIASVPARAGVKPGDVIGAQNASLVRQFVSPGVYYAVTHGMRMEIVPTGIIEWPPPYREATEKYSGQVRLSEDHRTVVGYVAGQPFPLIDVNDPDVAIKLVWNNVFRPISTDDYDLRFYDCQTEYIKPGQDQRIIDDIEIGHYAGYDLVGRTEVDPLPFDPDYRVTGRMWLFALYPILAPQESRGQGLIRWRYADPSKGDDSWDWQPGARRVRRLSEAMMS